MVNDLTHNFIIVGLDNSVLSYFESSFNDKYFDIHEVVKKLEAFQGSRMDNAEITISTYS